MTILVARPPFAAALVPVPGPFVPDAPICFVKCRGRVEFGRPVDFVCTWPRRWPIVGPRVPIPVAALRLLDRRPRVVH